MNYTFFVSKISVVAKAVARQKGVHLQKAPVSGFDACASIGRFVSLECARKMPEIKDLYGLIAYSITQPFVLSSPFDSLSIRNVSRETFSPHSLADAELGENTV